MSQKIPPKNSAKVGTGALEVLEVLNDDERVGYGPRASLERVQLRKRSKSAVTNPDYDDSRAPNLQMKFSRQRWINHRHLGACVHQKVVGAGMVDRYRRNDLGALDEPEA
jgi:hypothetical protein